MTTNNHPNTTTAPNDSVIRLRSGRTVDKGFYDVIKAQVLWRAPSLNPVLTYKSTKVCGKEFWGYLEDGERNLAGECILHMAIHGEVPLEHVGRDSENHQLYRVVVGY